MSDVEPTIHLPARDVPFPVTISDEARAFLSNPMFSAEPETPALGDLEGWRRHCAEINARLTMMMKMRSADYRTSHQQLRLSACDIYDIAPDEARSGEHAVLYIHGGAFIVGGGEAALYAAQQTAHLAGLRTVSVDYRMPPDHPFPAGLEDCVEAYRWLLERVPAERIAVYGGSAGANLAVTTILKARDEGLPLPRACIFGRNSEMLRTAAK